MRVRAFGWLALTLGVLTVEGVPLEPHGNKQSSLTFNIAKGVDGVHEVYLDSKTCQFSYRTANHPHGEEWKMEIKKQGQEYVCEITDLEIKPPHAAFYGFSAHMFGAKDDQLTSSEVWDHEGGLMLEDDAYLVEGLALRTTSHFDMKGVGKIVIKSA